MFLIRRAKVEDVPTLMKMARMVHFINLPPDRELLDRRVAWSRQSFLLAQETALTSTPRGKKKSKSTKGGSERATPNQSAMGGETNGGIASGLKNLSGKSPLFMFVMEETSLGGGAGGGVIGTSQVISRMGGPGDPNLSLQLARKHLFSQSLQVGVTHTTAKLHLDESGPTEIGGLIMQPSFRGHKLKLGRQIAMIRFHYMGLFRHMFADRVLAELMGPISIDGNSPFWDHCTRAFINMTYDEADGFCQESKEFILTLFPREEIYLTLIPAEARTVVGTVGTETLPAKTMLEKLGFKYHQRVDPFDGGPHLECVTDAISIVKETRRVKLASPVSGDNLKSRGLVSVIDAEGEFRAMETACQLDRGGKLVLPREVLSALAGEPGAEAGFTPLVTSTPAARRKTKR